MKNTRLQAARLALTLAAAVTLAGCDNGDDRMTVESVTVFGDSMQDVGTYKPATGDPNNPGKFTVNPGKVWVENIAAAYGLSLSPNRALTMDKDASFGATTQVGTATVVGGNGYAEGGARVASYPSQSGVGNNRLVAPVRVQIDNYLAAKQRFAPGSLVLIDGGDNDTYAQFSAVCWGTDENGLGLGAATLAIATEQVAVAARAQLANVRKLKDNRAGLVVVLAAFGWANTPFAGHYLSEAYQASGCYTRVTPQQVRDWTNQFNQIVRDGLSGLAGVVFVDASDLTQQAIGNPRKYGLADVAQPGCANTTPTSSAVFCTRATLAAPDADQTYLWSDSFHLSPRGHKMLSDLVQGRLDSVAKPRP
ncbi:MAG TPA: SGNH/GDSL hydrolase family protein [Rubrivivax sp.]|nr:SGNH/GDSL hydrolase family protein [Rubrivivax sp.]